MARKKKADKQAETDADIIEEARKRFKRCEEWEQLARSRYVEDIKFVNGDAENGYQWTDSDKRLRDGQKRPALTINKTRQYCLNITNDAKQNKPSIKIKPVGDKASYEGAQVMEGVVRHIEYQSSAQAIYDAANVTQVQGGYGAWRVLTRFADNDSFDQEIYIDGFRDPNSVFVDPDAKRPDKSDMRFAFVYEDVPTDEFERQYPAFADIVGTNQIITQNDNWIEKDYVRVAEYYRLSERPLELLAFKNDKGQLQIARSDALTPQLVKMLKEDPTTRTRPVMDNVVEWFKVAGDQIVDRDELPNSMIPIVVIIGEETIIDKVYDRKGHVRYLKDPQRVYNFWSTAAVEAVALQTKIPWLAPAAAIEGFTEVWRDSNIENYAVLPWKHIDESGNEIPKPERAQPPVMPQAYLTGMQVAQEELRMASGQYQADTGEPGNERSGKAIQARQRQGDNATYHFIDQQAIGIAYTGRIIIDLIPKIYDTKRVLKILAEDGTETAVVIDPQAKQEIVTEEQKAEAKAQTIFNPSFAKYSVEADVGPAYATRRQEAFNAFVQIMQGNPDLIKVAGDLMFRAADFPMAEELADRLKRLVPPQALGTGPSPEVLQLQQQNQALVQHLQQVIQEYTDEKNKMDLRKEKEADKTAVDVFRAETDRLKMLLGGINPEQIASLTAQLVLETMQTQLPQPQAQAQEPPSPIQPALDAYAQGQGATQQ